MAGLGIFLLALTVVVLVPGRLLTAILRLAPPRLEALVLSLALGMPAASAVYGLSAAVGLRWLYWAWPLAGLGTALVTWRRWRRAALSLLARPQASSAWPILLVAVALVPLWISPLYFRNLTRESDGRSSFYRLPDVVLHVALANELMHTVPPQNPVLPGHPANYHYGMDLLAASFTPFGLDSADLVVRFVPLLLTSFVVLAVYCCARALLGSAAGAALVAFLVMFGEDLSFVPGFLLRSRELWAIHFFGMPTTVSLYLLNPMLPAVGFLFVALLCLQRYFSSGRLGWLVCTAVVAAALVSCKVFVAAQLLAALGLTACAYGLLQRGLAPLNACVAASLAVLPQLFWVWSHNAGRMGIFLDPWPYVPGAFVRSGLGQTELLRLVGAAYTGHWSLLTACAFGLGLVLYLLFTFGARSFGLPAVVRGLRPSPGHALVFLLSVIVVSGPVASLLLDIGPHGYPRRQLYNDAVWFLLTSKHVSWLFSVGAVLKLRSSRTRALAAAGLIALSVPSTLQMLAVRFGEPMPRLSPQEVAMLDFLQRETRPGQVCLATEDVAQAILATVPCRTLALDVYAHSFLSPQEQARLRALRDGFWRAWRGENGVGRQVRWESLSALGADYLIVVRPRDGDAPALGNPADPAAPALELRFQNQIFSVFRIQRAQKG